MKLSSKTSTRNYYPFGMVQPGREYSVSSDYRYGFNGKEIDKNINSLTAYDYGFRIYNPALGRFLSVDPLTNKYPELTPYQFASNMPIIAIDLDGEEANIVTIYYSHIDGKESWRTNPRPYKGVFSYNSALAMSTNLTYYIHKYPVSTKDGYSWKQYGPATLSSYGPINYHTGRIDMSDAGIVFGMKVSFEFRTKATEVANNLGMDVNNLMTIMAFETGGSFSASQKNKAGSSGTGLVQFMKNTAEKLGTSTDKLSKMTAVEQLAYVEKYFSPYKGKLNSIEDAYMAVLYPKAVGKEEDFVVFEKYKCVNGKDVETLAYKQNSGLDTNHDGKITKAEISAVIKKKFVEGQKSKN